MFAYREFLVELVGQQRVWQLPEVELTQRAHAVDVLDVDIFGQVRDLFRVELVPDEARVQRLKSLTRLTTKAPSKDRLFTMYVLCRKYILTNQCKYALSCKLTSIRRCMCECSMVLLHCPLVTNSFAAVF